jgi:GNAT superfamily N-acetyltransferase
VTETAPPIVIRDDLRPGDLGRLIALHGTAYEGERGHFGLPFEAYVARTVAEFVLDNDCRGKVFLAERGAQLVASAAIVERSFDGGASRGQLRWVIADPSVRGTGLGRRLVERAVDFARASGWAEIHLETTTGLDASMALYEKLGFVIVSRTPERQWIAGLETIRMRKTL